MGRTWIGARVTVTPGRTWKRRVQVVDSGGTPADWYELHVLTLGKAGEGRTFKAVAAGDLESMKDAGRRQPHGYRVVYTAVVLDNSDSGTICPADVDG